MVAHEHIRFQRIGYLKRNADHDQQRGAAERNVDAGHDRDDARQCRYNNKEQSSDKGYFGNNLLDKSGSRLSGTDTRDHAGILAQVVRHLYRVILYRDIEEVKPDNQ